MDQSTLTHKEQFENIPDGLIINAPAKINLSLLIAGKRPDGFHEIETIMSKVTWYDQVKIEPSPDEQTHLICTGPHWAPQDETNLVWRAAKLIEEYTSKKLPLKLTLIKNIPAGTGLGSASSDAAATLIGINKLKNLELSEQELKNLAAQLGSDIPFFIGPQLAYCTGRGEKISVIDNIFPFMALLITPDISVSTVSIYKNYTHNEQLYLQYSDIISPNIQKKNVDLIAKMCANMLKESCFKLNSDLAKLAHDLTSLGIKRLCLSGSGSAMFALIKESDLVTAKNYQKQIKDRFNCKSVLVYNNRW